MTAFSEQITAAEQRYRAHKTARNRRLQAIRERRPFHADSPERVGQWFRRRGFSAAIAARAVRDGAVPAEVSESFAPSADDVGLERVLGTADFLGVAFLERGLQASRTVGRVAINGGTGRTDGYGTGSLVSPQLLLTNNHVLADPSIAAGSVVEFDYYVRGDGSPGSIVSFALEPQRFFLTDKKLDYTLVAVAPRGTNGIRLDSYGWNTLFPEEGKAIVGQWVNIIQHPNGEPKQLVLRNNQIVDLPDDFLHYVADTSPGSSGSPVFNDRWEVVALHHSGVPERDGQGRLLNVDGRPWDAGQGEHRIKWRANEGARASRLVRDIERKNLSADWSAMFKEALNMTSSRLYTPPATLPSPPGDRVASAEVQADGTATWTIPLRVSVQLGGSSSLLNIPGGPLPDPVRAVPPDEKSLLAMARQQLARPDVIGVRIGYCFKNGWITSERAIVVKVRRKQTLRELSASGTAALPSVFVGYPVQVTGPSLEDLVQGSSPGLSESLATLDGLRTEEITYKPRPDIPLKLVEGQMDVNLHLSPDAGWPMLSRFIAGTQRKLVIGMYDFGAPHIVDALTALKKKKLAALQLTMQRGESLGSGTKKDDLADTKVVERLSKAFGAKFKFGWIKIGVKNGWVGSSYHIKVAVRDEKAFWLSSGNWQSSNQPKLGDLTASRAADYSPLTTYNREWHAIVENPALARVFEGYLNHDLKSGSDAAFDEMVAALPMLYVPEREAFRKPRQPDYRYFKPLKLAGRLRVTPVLSPDNYFQTLLGLVKGAKREILIQNQTFNAPTGPKQVHLQELMEVLVAKQKRMPVRIIFRLLMAAKARENLEGLKECGFNTDDIKVQSGLHTKGVIVDGEKVLLGSHNISEMGVSVNRDASLLFESEKIAAHFRDIFEHDWANLAQQWIGDDTEAAWTESSSGPIGGQAGYEVLTPKEYLELM